MNFNNYNHLSIYLIIFLVFMAVAEIALKAITLWRSAQNKQKGWFIAIFILNSAGIVPIIYLLLNKNKKTK